MYFAPVVAVLLVFGFLSCLFAFIKGGAAERMGAAIILANLVAGMVTEALSVKDHVIGLAVDGLTALALLLVTIRYASFWLGGVMLLYAVQFTLHAYYVVLGRPRDLIHIVVNNIDFFAICLCLALGTWLSQRRRVGQAFPMKSAAPAP